MASHKKGRWSSSSLPEDILFSEILPSMPANAVARCRCVSPSWNHTLSSPSFIQHHLQRANIKPKLFFDSPSSDPSSDRYFYTWQPGDGPAIKKLARHGLLNRFIESKTLHGLVLIFVNSAEERGYYVCNPCTGALLPLPDTKAEQKMHSTEIQPYPRCYESVTYGLGHSSATNEYKVVRLFSDDLWTGAAPCCEVFVLGTPAYWRPTAQQPPSCIVEGQEQAVFLNGRLHFLCMDGGILTLDINSETFGSLSTPLPFGSLFSPSLDENGAWALMTELDGCLCVCHGDKCANLYHIWLLRDHEAQHWEQLCCVDPLAWSEPDRVLLQPATWTAPLIRMHNIDNNGKKNKKIMFGTSTCKVFTFDPQVGGAPEILYQPEIGISHRFLAPALFEESLVPVGYTIEEMVFSSPSTKGVSDVLKWLPARSVVELSLVCREWRALITTSRFIRSHTIHANLINRPPCLKFVMDRSFGSFVNVDGNISPMFQPEATPGRFECSQPCHGLNVGSCNGSEFLFNPAIGYHDFLREDRDRSPFTNIRLGLGFDSDINDHVLVFVSYTEKNDTHCYMRHVQNPDESTMIDPPPRPLADIQPAYVEGKIYWIVEPKPSSAACELVVINTTMGGKFEVLQGPPCKHENGRMSVLELHGSICVACSRRDPDAIDVWMMRDNQEKNLEYRIELGMFLKEYTADNTTLMGINPVDGRILLNTGRSLGYYDPKTVALEIIYTLNRPQDNDRFCVVICQESLLHPPSQPF